MKKVIYVLILSLIFIIPTFANPKMKSVSVNGNSLNIYAYETINEFDINGNLIHSITAFGDEEWYEYDSTNHLIKSAKQKQNEPIITAEYSYDENWHLTGIFYSDGTKYTRKNITAVAGFHQGYISNTNEKLIYNAAGQILHYRDENGIEYYFFYNDKGYLSKKRSPNDTIYYDYDFYGNCVHEKHKNYEIHFINEYDDKGRILRITTSTGVEYAYSYNKNGLLIYKKDTSSYTQEEWYEYEFFPDNKTVKIMHIYFKA